MTALYEAPGAIRGFVEFAHLEGDRAHANKILLILLLNEHKYWQLLSFSGKGKSGKNNTFVERNFLNEGIELSAVNIYWCKELFRTIWVKHSINHMRVFHIAVSEC